MRITQKGQVTIPEPIRKKYGLLPYANVEFIEDNGKVYIIIAKEKKHRGHTIVKNLRGSGTVRMTTDEILNLTRGKE
jgi:AbrB family looped-hinge helix DNA binding protein